MANWRRNEDVSEVVIHSSVVVIDTNDGLLGRGGGGSVYSAMYNGQKAAVKILSSDGDIPNNERHNLKKEAQRLRASSQHPNIIDLLGVMMETDNYSLVLEYMHFGTSISFIKEFDVGVPLRVQFVKQIISAMAWLHSQQPPVKHLDLKADNVLINNYFNAKISDFGLSEWRTITMAYSKTPLVQGPRCGTITHVPPEVFEDINQKGKVEEDVYSFAITVWEIFTGESPFKGCHNNIELIRSAVLRNQRPDLSVIVKQCPQLIVDMIKCSWDEQPRMRPTFKDMENQINPVYLALQHILPDSIRYIRQEILSKYNETHEKYECTKHFDNQPESPVKMDGSATKNIPEARPQVNDQVAEVTADTSRELGAEMQTNAESVENRLNVLSLNAPDSPTNQQSTVVHSGRVVTNPGASRNIGLVHVPINETEQNREDNSDSTRGKEESGIGLSGIVSLKDKQYVPGSEISHPHGPFAQPASTLVGEPGVDEYLGQNTRAELNDVSGAEAVNMFVTNLSATNPEMVQALLQNPETLQNLLSLIQSPTAERDGQLVFNSRLSELRPLSGAIPRFVNTCSREILEGTDSNIGSVFVDELSGQTLNSSRQTAVPVPSGQQVMGSNQAADTVRMFPAPDQTAQTLNSSRQTAVPVPSGQQVTGSSQAADTVRMLPAPDQTQTGSQHSNTLVVNGIRRIAAPVATTGQEQQNQQSVIIGQPRQMAGSSQQARFITPTVPQTSMQTAMPNVRPQSQQPFQLGQPFIMPAVGDFRHGQATIIGQPIASNLGTNLGQASMRPSAAGAAAGQQQQQTVTRQTTVPQPVVNKVYQQIPQVLDPSQRQQQTGNQQLAQANPEVFQPQGQARSPVHVQPSAEKSNSQTNSRPAGNQEYTGTRQQAPASDPAGTQKQTFTISHKHAGGGFTTMIMNPDMDFPPNMQIGNNNFMVVGDSKRKAAKKPKCRKSQLTRCTDDLSTNHMDVVSVEIGKDWKRLCRELDMTEADIEQLQFDYHVSGLYEIMYQGIQRWIQRNGRLANVHKMAMALWEIDRDDIALKLH